MMSRNDPQNLIQPRTLKGFRDFLPDVMMRREHLIGIAQRVYRSYGYCPIDTPALEYMDILAGKGSEETDRQLYRFEDHGGRQVGMRFDLTVPLARFVAQHINELGTPFKRYHIATVWRGENTQRGRYREFMQCDFDTIGTSSIVADIEMVLVIHDLMQALGISAFTVRINNRKVLNGLLEKLNSLALASEILRALDKLPKIGREKVVSEMIQVGLSETQCVAIIDFAELTGPLDQVLSQLATVVEGSETGEEGVAQLRELFDGVLAAGVSPGRLQLDVSIARGLDYYTGTIVETFLDHLPKIGSVCSGGRYDDLASLFTKQRLPGVGASLGLDRLLAALDELDSTQCKAPPAPVFIPYFDSEKLQAYLQLASLVRSAGIRVDFYPEAKKLGQQLKFASERGFRIALIQGREELEKRTCQVKDLRNRDTREVSMADGHDELVAVISEILGQTAAAHSPEKTLESNRLE